jgi:WD40 repeat protein
MMAFELYQAKDRTYREHGEEINQLAWHPSIAHHVATASGDRLVKIFDTRTDRSQTTIETKGGIAFRFFEYNWMIF